MLTLGHQSAKLNSMNLSPERHGDEQVPAAYLKFTCEVSNDVLSEFDPGLKSSFYRKADASDSQSELLNEPGHLPKLRFPKIPGIKWDADMIGAHLTVHYGPSGKGDIELTVDVDQFAFEMKDGGSVAVSFRAAAKPDEKQVGKLYGLIQTEVDISLAPAEAEAEA